jgi:succinate dehydrogenase/fumarate reductase flavoprotein subunit
MGNSLLDIIVFGRLAGKNAAKKARERTQVNARGKLGMQHVNDYAQLLAESGIRTGKTSPLLLPHYARRQN